MSDNPNRAANNPDDASNENSVENALVTVESRENGVRVLRLNNGKLNPLSVEVLAELAAAATDAARSNARAVVVTGNSRAFAAGADISQFTAGTEPFELADAERVAQIGASFLTALNAIAALPCPTIAAVSGVALGGGCELALACDLRIASPRALLGQPEILLGIIPGGGGTQRLTRLVGPAKAKDLIFSGRNIDAAEAAKIGLVDRIAADPESVLPEAIAWADTFAAGPADAIALAKSAIDEGLEGTLEDGLRIEQALFVRSFSTGDARVGVESFLSNGPGKARFV